MGLSFGKLIVLALVVAVVWTVFRYARRVEATARALRRELERRRGGGQAPRSIAAEDLVKCSVCGAYVAGRAAQSCGRPDCPYGR
ncbi:MAG TPA: hypothetical protein VLV50_11530 [Stellaceae bacterium]|nr:hypothetical protein [Stellaceae bacterium]